VITFLVYHRIGSPGGRSLDTATFREDLETIAASGVPVWDAGEASLPVRGTGVVLSFDDATDDHCTIAQPILATFGFPAVFYVPTARLGTEGHLSAEHLRRLDAAGHTIGSHSHTHARLDRLTAAEVLEELTTSREMIAGIVGRAPLHFAPPGGLYPPTALQQAEEAGYRFFRTMKWGFNRTLDPVDIHVLPMEAPWSRRFLIWSLRGRSDLALRSMHGVKLGLRRALPDRIYRRLRSSLEPR